MPAWIIDPIVTHNLAHVLMEALYVTTARPSVGPHRTVDAETLLSHALRDYAEAIVKAARG